MRWRVGLLSIALATGCDSVGCGEQRIYCTRNPTLLDGPALRDGPLEMPTARGSAAVVTALALGIGGQEAIRLVLSTTPLHCEEVTFSLSPTSDVPTGALRVFQPDGTSGPERAGTVAFLTIAPVLYDVRVDKHSSRWMMVPTQETWRVTGAEGAASSRLWQPESRSTVEPARGAASKGKRTKVRISIVNGASTIAGMLEIEGCGYATPSAAPRSQPSLAVRFDDRPVAIQGATFRPSEHGDFRLELSSAPLDCRHASFGDVRLGIEGKSMRVQGDAVAREWGYGHHLYVDRLDGGVIGDVDAGVAARATFQVRGVIRGGIVGEAELDPKNVLDVRSVERQLHVEGRVDALVCP